MRRKPYAAAFETTPDRIAATSGEDSRYASGSQPCSGKSGALIANAATKPRKTQSLGAAPDADEHIERDHHRFEEGVEEEQVLRREDADDGSRQEEHQPHVC